MAQRVSLPPLVQLLSVAMARTGVAPIAVLLQQAHPSLSLRVKTPAAREVASGQPGGEKILVSGCKVPWLGTAPAGDGAQQGRGTVQAHSLERETARVILCNKRFFSCKSRSDELQTDVRNPSPALLPSTMPTVLTHQASVSLLSVCPVLPEQAGRAAGVGSAPITHLIIYLEPDDLIAPG